MENKPYLNRFAISFSRMARVGPDKENVFSQNTITTIKNFKIYIEII